VPTSFLPWWDNAAQRQVFDLIRGLIEILVPFTDSDRFPEPRVDVPAPIPLQAGQRFR
jgi:hypothetical protein